MPSPDDDLIALIDRVATGDDGALKDLYDLTASRLFGLAFRVTGRREWAEDALQDSFLYVWRNAGDYRASLSPPLAWLGLIVRSRALDLLRRQRSEPSGQAQPLDDDWGDQTASDAPGPTELHQRSEQAWALHQCLQRLEGRQRAVIGMAYLRDLSHGELAEQLKVPLGTVKTWIRRGMEQLRTCMARFA